ncbi:glycoside hydrolase family 18 protein [Apiospora aurea]|uniref:chitinase n=1 Tax=Apiospora aurea TaxID=335848 RepID=A0ABR1QPD3_9PEZI
MPANPTAPVMAIEQPLRNIMYLTGQHPVIPDLSLTETITHVVLAFMRSESFNEEEPGLSWPLFLSVKEVRTRFQPGTKIMVAIGGWGDTMGFSKAARDERSRRRFAENVAGMVKATGADGVDIDWEYPGGNGEDYKQVPNSKKAWEAGAYPHLLFALRHALGPSRIISAAVPGLPRDIALAFDSVTVPSIMDSVDFLNVMTYDLMNRRDTVTKHHTGVAGSLEAIDMYLKAGAPPAQLNLGFAFYVKYFRVPHNACSATNTTSGSDSGSDSNPAGLNCPTGPMEDPDTGADLGRTGGFSYHDAVPAEVADSFQKALREGTYDKVGGGYYYLDTDAGMKEDDLFWTFDTPKAIMKKFPPIVEAKGLGGVFAWGLGEDAPEFRHLKIVFAQMLQAQILGSARDRDEL